MRRGVLSFQLLVVVILSSTVLVIVLKRWFPAYTALNYLGPLLCLLAAIGIATWLKRQ